MDFEHDVLWLSKGNLAYSELLRPSSPLHRSYLFRSGWLRSILAVHVLNLTSW